MEIPLITRPVDSLCPLTFDLVFLLDRAFLVLYTLTINKEILIKYHLDLFLSETNTYPPEPIVSLKVERESRIICLSKDKGQKLPDKPSSF